MGGSWRTVEPQKGDKMALGIVQAGYKNSLYVSPAGNQPELEFSYAELLAELTTELELALEGGAKEEVPDFEEGLNSAEDDEQTETYSARKKEWEELLEQAKVVEAMLRQMLEQGLGQQKEEQQKASHQEEEELDNAFDSIGVPVTAEGKSSSCPETAGSAGSSQSLQTCIGNGAEYLNLMGGGRKTAYSRTICLTCETDCDRKKQWKITE